MADRWTDQTRSLAVDALLSLVPVAHEYSHSVLAYEAAGRRADVVLTALADAGLLLQPDAEPDRQKWYERRVKALEDLLVCFRIGRAPSERLHDEMRRTGKYIDDRGQWREVPDA